MKQAADLPWVVLDLAGQAFAINSRFVKEILICPAVDAVPGAPAWVRGVMTLRGRVLPAVDLRLRLGKTSAQEEADSLCSLLHQREQDHLRWLNELEASLKEERAFTLAIDPHQCAFGKWYDAYRSDNLVVSTFLQRFDAPHKAIHALATQAHALVEAGRRGHALELIAQARTGTLSRLVQLFSRLREIVQESRREVAVIVQGGQEFAACVDAVTAVERLHPDAQEALREDALALDGGTVIDSILKRRSGSPMALVLNVESLLSGFAA